jgi:hypothetical protein
MAWYLAVRYTNGLNPTPWTVPLTVIVIQVFGFFPM